MKRSALAAGVVLLLLAAGGWYWWHGAAMPAAQSQAAAPVPPEASAAVAAPATVTIRNVTVSSGVPIRLVQKPRINVPPPPYGPAYKALEAQARAGDHTAQYQLSLLLYECRDVPADEGALNRVIEHTYETRSRAGWEVDSPAEEEKTMRRRYAECDGVPADQRGQYREWMQQAADAGLMDAQLDLPLHLPPGDYCQFISECSPQQRARQEALDKEAVDYLGRARDAGSAVAMWTFASWYSEGEVLPQSDIESYANFSALDQVFDAAGQPRRFDSLLEDMRNRMRPADLEQAQALSRTLLSNPNCCILEP